MDDFLEKPLRMAIEFLEKHQLRYAIIGGLALAQWNYIRATKDVDIKVLVSDLDYTAVRRSIQTAFPDRARTNAPDNAFIVAVNVESIIVDFLLTLPGYEEQLIERAVERDLGGWSAWVCTAEDLIIQKVSAGRPKDWIDVEGLLIAQRGKLDHPYIEDWLDQFAQALENPDLLEKYHQVRRQVESLRQA
jgi:predicted nucleotidyltransferase